MTSVEKRKVAMKNSSLPTTFCWKIKKHFWGKQCPVCNMSMAIEKEFGLECWIPSVQHNKPISKGGEHELGNISIICKKCNVSIRDNETGSLNADEVTKAWHEMV